MHRAQGRILVIRGGAIGDFILTLPVFTALRERFQETRIEVLGYPHIAGLAFAGGLVDGVQSIEARALAGFFARNGTLDACLADYFAGFAVVISYLYDPDGIFRGNFERCSRAQFIQGPHRPDEKLGTHASEVFLQPLERLAIFDADTIPRLNFAPCAGESQNASHDRFLALHPGSGSERKNWPEENWATLIARLVTETTWNMLLIGGEAETGRVERLARLLPGSRMEVARNLPLPELAIRLRNCAFFLGHDSGITHLAAAVGLSGMALWGASKAEIWSPRGGDIELLHANDGLERLAVDTVFNRLTARFGS